MKIRVSVVSEGEMVLFNVFLGDISDWMVYVLVCDGVWEGC